MFKGNCNDITVDFIKNTCPLITNSNALGNDDDIDLIEPNDTKNDDKKVYFVRIVAKKERSSLSNHL